MNTPTHRLIRNISTVAALGAAICFSTTPAQAVNYAGNGNTGFGGPVGNGVLSVTDDHTNITVNLQRGNSGNLNDVVAIYIDTGTGGYTNTASFTDTGGGNGPEQKGISGFDGSNRSVLVFTNGFKPGYAIAIKSDFMDVWSLANPASFSFLAGAGGYNASSANFTLTFPCGKIGLATNVPVTIKIFGTLLNPNGAYRSTEAIAGNDVTDAFGQGPKLFTNTAYATYNFAPAVIPTYAVKFSVDMSAQAALGNFIPGTDPVYCGGSFQTNPFAFDDFPLVQSNSSAIYTNTYLVADPTNTVETYKFKFHSVGNATDSYDSDPNRSFTLKSGGQVVPLVYFDNVTPPAPNPSATTNYITFKIDMGPQIYLGHFDPGAGDVVSVFGSFEQPRWSGNFPPNYKLTNNVTLSGNASNIYTAVFPDGNYPGTVTQYKYVIIPVGNTATNYENGSDRTLVTPTGATTLPTAFFSGVSGYASNNITFLVDMTVPILTHTFNPGSGDTVGCAGTFQTNSFGVGANGFTLANLTGNIYRGTYVDRNQPGSVERYKFVVNTNGGGTLFELPASTGGGDRVFLLGSSDATNPLVFWNDLNTNQVLLEPTTITFTVNMAGAVDLYGFPFDVANDVVVINGDFVTPAWNSYPNNVPPFFWTDANFYDPIDSISDYGPGNPYGPNFILQNSGDSQHFTGTFTIPAGHSHLVNYKYGIYHDSSQFMTNCDNEASSGSDHHRYVRAVGTYNFPTDIFGIQRTSQSAATEVLYGIATGTATAGHLPVSWLGFPGVHLQTSTNLANQVWQDLSGTDGAGTTNWPTTGDVARFFRLWPTPQ